MNQFNGFFQGNVVLPQQAPMSTSMYVPVTMQQQAQPYFSPEQVSMLNMYDAKSNIDTNNYIRRKAADTEAKLLINQQKAEQEKARMDTIDRRRTERELTVEKLIEDDDGHLRLIQTRPDGSKALSEPIMDCSNIGVSNLYSTSNKEGILRFKLKDLDDEFFVDKNIAPKRLLTILRKHGISIRVFRDRNKELQELLYQHVLTKATPKEICGFYGWNRMSDSRWKFENDVSNTMEGIRYER